MRILHRRRFAHETLAWGAGVAAAASAVPTVHATPRAVKDDISLAQWALVQEIRDGLWKTLDFPRIAREDFGLNGIEFVNTLFEVPTASYLSRLKQNARDHGVTMVLIMVDAEGETCTPSAEERRRTVIHHRKWIDIAAELGCHAVRTNCRGGENIDRTEALEWAAETYHMMLEYAVPAGISILIENHGGVSDDADWMVALMKKVNHLYFGSYPDWRAPTATFDNYAYVEKMLPWAGGMSYRNQPTEEGTARLIRLCRDAGYRGWYGIESSGREAIRQGIGLLRKYLELPAGTA